MNVIDKYKAFNKEITAEEVENEKLVKEIKILKSDSFYKHEGIYELIDYDEKDKDSNCINKECDRICKDYCLFFKNKKTGRCIWSCRIRSWIRI